MTRTSVDGCRSRATIPDRHARRLQRAIADRRQGASPQTSPADAAFRGADGDPVLVNTSFNIRGEPIVCTPEEACRCFLATDMDALVLENHLLVKPEMPVALTERKRARYRASFEPD